MSDPTVNVWCPRTIRPVMPVVGNAIDVDSQSVL